MTQPTSLTAAADPTPDPMIPVRQLVGLGLLVIASATVPAAVRAQLSAEALHAVLCLGSGGLIPAGEPAGDPLVFAGHCTLCWQTLGLALSGAVLALMPSRRDQPAQPRAQRS